MQKALPTIGSILEREEVQNVHRMYGSTRATRRCFVNETAFPAAAGSATNPKYFPTYRAGPAAVLGNVTRPDPKSSLYKRYRETSLDQWFADEVVPALDPLIAGTGIVYVGWGDPKDFSVEWKDTNAASYSILQHNAKRVGVTCLHAGRSIRTSEVPHFYVTEERLIDAMATFKDKTVLVGSPGTFQEVFPREDLLELRKKYLDKMIETKDITLAQENLDPDYALQFGNTVDILFFEFSVDFLEKVNEWPFFTVSAAPPATGTADVAIGYHIGTKFNVQDVEDEHKASPTPPHLAAIIFCNTRCVSVGQVVSVGSGLITDISTMEVGSSGAPKLAFEGHKLTAFGISVGGYYDVPITSPADWTVFPGSLYSYEVVLPEPGRSDDILSRNRNVILGFHHSCVKKMLAAI